MSQVSDVQHPLSTPHEQVIALLVRGVNERDIRKLIARHWPGVNPQRVMLEAAEHFQNVGNCELDVIFGWAMEVYRDLYAKMVEDKDYAGAAKIVKELVAIAKASHVHRENPQAEIHATIESTDDID